jgi:hypothetical protein
MAWASAQTTGSPTRKAVLLALANRLNHDSGLCCPNVDAICVETEFGEKAVRDALKQLEADGLISRLRRRKENGHLGGYIYSFPHLSPPVADTASPPVAGTGHNQEEPSNQETLAAAPRERKPGKPNPVWDALVKVSGFNPQTPDAKGDFGKTVAQLRSVIPEDATVEQIETAMGVRRARFERLFPGATFTHRVLRGKWDELGATGSLGSAAEARGDDSELEDDGTGHATF